VDELLIRHPQVPARSRALAGVAIMHAATIIGASWR
jgi:hypothetical protein